MLTFQKLRVANQQRCDAIHVGKESWGVVDWSNAMAGEAGEVCNAVKKLRRHQTGTTRSSDPPTVEAAIADIAEELADTILYAELLAGYLDIDLEQAIIDKFNKVSELIDSPIRL